MSPATPISINLEVFQHPRPYESGSFVNREIELEIIAKKVQTGQGGGPISEPIVNYWGVSGIGKTWLIHHIHHLYRYSHPTEGTTLQPTFALLLLFQPDPVTHSPGTVIQTFALQSLDQLKEVITEDEEVHLRQAAETQNVEAFIRAMQSLSKRFIPILLFDATEQLNTANWEKLEQQVIEPIVSANRVLVVISGRRQAPRWRRFEVRRRVMESDATQVMPFTQKGVERQLRTYNYRLPTNMLSAYTAGNPLLVDVVARNFDAWQIGPEAALDDSHQNALIQILRAAEEKLLESVPIELRRILYIIIPLRSYLGEALRFMMGQIGDDYKNVPDVHYFQILRKLDGTEIVWWDKVQRAYTTSQVVRKLINRRLMLEDSQAFIQLHKRALDMYWHWAKDIPKVSEDYLQEILFHQGMIYQAGHNLEVLHAGINKAIAFARENLVSDRLIRLKQAIAGDEKREGDQELRELLPEDLYRELSDELTSLISPTSQTGEQGG